MQAFVSSTTVVRFSALSENISTRTVFGSKRWTITPMTRRSNPRYFNRQAPVNHMVRSHDNRVLANRIACTTGLVRSYTAVRAGLLMSAYGGAVVVKCRQSHKLAEIVETDRSEDLDVGLGIPELSAVPSAVAVGARARAENHTSTHTHTHSLHAHSADHPFQQAPVHVGVECGEGGTWDERGHELVEVGERTDRSILPVPTEFTDSLSPRNGNSGHGSAVPERNSDRNTYTSRGAEINRDVNRDEPALLTMAELEIEQGIDWGADERPTAGTVESAYSHASTPSAHTHTEHGVDGLNGPPTYMGEGADGGVYAHTDVRHTGTSQALQTHRLEDGEIRNDIERHAVSADGCTHTPPTQGLNEWVHEEGIDWEGSLERERGGSSPHTRTHEDLYANAVGDKYADTHADTYASAHAQADRRVGSGYASLDTHTQTHKLTKAQKRNMAAAEKEMTQHHTDAYNSTGNRSNEGNQHHANNQTENTQYLDYVEQAFYAATHPDQMLQVLEATKDRLPTRFVNMALEKLVTLSSTRSVQQSVVNNTKYRAAIAEGSLAMQPVPGQFESHSEAIKFLRHRVELGEDIHVDKVGQELNMVGKPLPNVGAAYTVRGRTEVWGEYESQGFSQSRKDKDTKAAGVQELLKLSVDMFMQHVSATQPATARNSTWNVINRTRSSSINGTRDGASGRARKEGSGKKKVKKKESSGVTNPGGNAGKSGKLMGRQTPPASKKSKNISKNKKRKGTDVSVDRHTRAPPTSPSLDVPHYAGGKQLHTHSPTGQLSMDTHTHSPTGQSSMNTHTDKYTVPVIADSAITHGYEGHRTLTPLSQDADALSKNTHTHHEVLAHMPHTDTSLHSASEPVEHGMGHSPAQYTGIGDRDVATVEAHTRNWHDTATRAAMCSSHAYTTDQGVGGEGSPFFCEIGDRTGGGPKNWEPGALRRELGDCADVYGGESESKWAVQNYAYSQSPSHAHAHSHALTRMYKHAQIHTHVHAHAQAFAWHARVLNGVLGGARTLTRTRGYAADVQGFPYTQVHRHMRSSLHLGCGYRPGGCGGDGTGVVVGKPGNVLECDAGIPGRQALVASSVHAVNVSEPRRRYTNGAHTQQHTQALTQVHTQHHTQAHTQKTHIQSQAHALSDTSTSAYEHAATTQDIPSPPADPNLDPAHHYSTTSPTQRRNLRDILYLLDCTRAAGYTPPGLIPLLARVDVGIDMYTPARTLSRVALALRANDMIAATRLTGLHGVLKTETSRRLLSEAECMPLVSVIQLLCTHMDCGIDMTETSRRLKPVLTDLSTWHILQADDLTDLLRVLTRSHLVTPRIIDYVVHRSADMIASAQNLLLSPTNQIDAINSNWLMRAENPKPDPVKDPFNYVMGPFAAVHVCKALVWVCRELHKDLYRVQTGRASWYQYRKSPPTRTVSSGSEYVNDDHIRTDENCHLQAETHYEATRRILMNRKLSPRERRRKKDKVVIERQEMVIQGYAEELSLAKSSTRTMVNLTTDYVLSCLETQSTHTHAQLGAHVRTGTQAPHTLLEGKAGRAIGAWEVSLLVKCMGQTGSMTEYQLKQLTHVFATHMHSFNLRFLAKTSRWLVAACLKGGYEIPLPLYEDILFRVYHNHLSELEHWHLRGFDFAFRHTKLRGELITKYIEASKKLFLKETRKLASRKYKREHYYFDAK